ncbi:Transposon Ty3-I Gag-Pol polyprotein [Vitis vinifera]|uniref:Transposon Ty3-I Gag-Pol polyprotein n=1 Tax=Vitis vinifera TaxID=29760 RepID=A0A438IZV2_VITVI|nr:Transposon Ty3-I Gag-Pol polyprotein [Vitis vinifera]
MFVRIYLLHDDVYDSSFMDLSIFEYLPVSRDIALFTPSSPTSQIFDIDDEIAQHDSDDDSFLLLIRTPLIKSFTCYRGHEDMSALIHLSSSIVCHFCPCRPVKQKLRRLHPRWSLQVKRRSRSSLVWILLVVEYPEWLANVVPVPKKDGKVRVCVDFRDLNKASPKDDFPLPHIDMLVDSTQVIRCCPLWTIFRVQSDLDGSRGHGENVFITEWGTYCYRVMPFGLKNAGATY